MSITETRLQLIPDPELPAHYAAYKVGDSDVWHAFARAFDPAGKTFVTLHVAVSYPWLKQEISRVLLALEDTRPGGGSLQAALEGCGYDTEDAEVAGFWSSIKKIASSIANNKLVQRAQELGVRLIVPGAGESSPKAEQIARELVDKASKGDKDSQAKINLVADGAKAGNEKDQRALYLLAEQDELRKLQAAGVTPGSMSGAAPTWAPPRSNAGLSPNNPYRGRDQRARPSDQAVQWEVVKHRREVEAKEKGRHEGALKRKKAEYDKRLAERARSEKKKDAAQRRAKEEREKKAQEAKEQAEQQRQEEQQAREDERRAEEQARQDALAEREEARGARQAELEQQKLQMQMQLEQQKLAMQQQLAMARLQPQGGGGGGGGYTPQPGDVVVDEGGGGGGRGDPQDDTTADSLARQQDEVQQLEASSQSELSGGDADFNAVLRAQVAAGRVLDNG